MGQYMVQGGVYMVHFNIHDLLIRDVKCPIQNSVKKGPIIRSRHIDLKNTFT